MRYGGVAAEADWRVICLSCKWRPLELIYLRSETQRDLLEMYVTAFSRVLSYCLFVVCCLLICLFVRLSFVSFYYTSMLLR